MACIDTMAYLFFGADGYPLQTRGVSDVAHANNVPLIVDNTVATPYLMDLNATNGTFLNGERIEPQRYYQLLEKDAVKFGASTREYVLLDEDSAK